MSELIEHELNQLNGKLVVMVRQGFGTQSDSWNGIIETQTNAYPLQFQVKAVSGYTILFTAEDVKKIEVSIIRLKGPSDYVAKLPTLDIL